MKRFSNLRPILAGEPLVFINAGSRHSVSGVCSAPVSVYAQGDDQSEATLFAYFPAGDFKFDIGHTTSFGIHFVLHGDGEICVYRNPESLLLTPSAEDTWAVYEHRAAVDPALAAVQRQVMSIAQGLAAAQAENRRLRQAVPPPAIQPVPSAASQPEPEPATPPAEPDKTEGGEDAAK